MTDSLSFTTTLKEKEVQIDGKTYTIKELDGIGFSKWQEQIGGKASLGADGKIQVTDLNIKDPTLALLQLCLYGEDGKLVPVSVMAKWPQKTVLKSLFEIAQELSGLNDKSAKSQDAEAKN
jgi:hypothetical protein